MYIGNGMMVEAPHTGDVVHVVPVYRDGLYGVARPGL
jgi:cell wall-associated NlpC family hydrolase